MSLIPDRDATPALSEDGVKQNGDSFQFTNPSFQPDASEEERGDDSPRPTPGDNNNRRLSPDKESEADSSHDATVTVSNSTGPAETAVVPHELVTALKAAKDRNSIDVKTGDHTLIIKTADADDDYCDSSSDDEDGVYFEKADFEDNKCTLCIDATLGRARRLVRRQTPRIGACCYVLLALCGAGLLVWAIVLDFERAVPLLVLACVLIFILLCYMIHKHCGARIYKNIIKPAQQPFNRVWRYLRW
jgi:hypothetical protein